jgi:hypothetical protein
LVCHLRCLEHHEGTRLKCREHGLAVARRYIAAYIGSANLTGPGLAGHIELGVLVRGAVAKQVEEFWILCHQLGLFVEV